ncbi:MAG: hypothetical protein IJW18_01630 [Lachnospiraceae bacterium]|nr:hypothetical protein [Lachnospiraceae bacterium]
MTEFFLSIINMSISASWLILAVLILRFASRKAPKWVNVLLWGIVALRLICPLTIESPVSLIPKSVGNGALVSEWMDTYVGEVSIIHDDSMHYEAAVTAGREPISDGNGGHYVVTKYDQLGEPSTIRNSIMPVLSIIWITGMVSLILYTTISYIKLRRKVATAVLYTNNVFQSENVVSPFVLGVLRPRIYIPFKLEGQDLEHVVAHERAHIQRRDHWWKPLGFLLLTIHWFNPLMWLAYILLCRDIELACDEKVIKKLDNEQRANYTQALVTCSVNRKVIAACPLAFGEVGVKDRVKSVMNYKKPAFWIIVLAVITCVIVAVCFLTNPLNGEPQPTQVSDTNTNINTNTDTGTTYIYENEGFPNNFTITLYENGTFTYYEGWYSSYLGIGSWVQEGDIITLTDDDNVGYPLVNHFRLDGRNLVFLAEDSSNFIYVKIKDGECFYHWSDALTNKDLPQIDTKLELEAFNNLLSGDRTLLNSEQAAMWWIPDFQDGVLEYEYTYMDLDGDNVLELLIQMVDSPEGYNGVFNYENGELFCWNSDAMEMSGRDYPLTNGTMVRQYDFNGTRSYTVFQYLPNGETETLSTFFAREELIDESSTDPCPYYTIDGHEVDKAVFDEQLKNSITSQRLTRSDWIKN